MLKNKLLRLIIVFNIFIPAVSTLANESISVIEPVRVELYGGLNWNDPNDDLLSQRILNKLEQKLIGKIEFVRIAATHQRAWQDLKTTSNSCVFNALKTPRRIANANFSRYPISVSPPLRFFTSPHSTFENPFSFSQLENALHRYKIGIVEGRHYSPKINKFKRKHPEFFYVQESIDRTERLLGMLNKRRIEGFIDYSESVKKAEKIVSKKINFRMLEIKGERQFVGGYFACSNTDEGNNIITRINDVVTTAQFKAWVVEQHKGYFGKQEDERLIPHLINNIYN